MESVSWNAVFHYTHIQVPVEKFLQYFLAGAIEVNTQYESYIRATCPEVSHLGLYTHDSLKGYKWGHEDNP